MQNPSTTGLPLLFTGVRRFAVRLMAVGAVLCGIRASAADAE